MHAFKWARPVGWWFPGLWIAGIPWGASIVLTPGMASRDCHSNSLGHSLSGVIFGRSTEDSNVQTSLGTASFILYFLFRFVFLKNPQTILNNFWSTISAFSRHDASGSFMFACGWMIFTRLCVKCLKCCPLSYFNENSGALALETPTWRLQTVLIQRKLRTPFSPVPWLPTFGLHKVYA